MAGTWPSTRRRRIWCPVTPTTPATCLSGTGSWAPPAGSACPAPKPRATAAASARRSVRQAGTSPSVRVRRTWSPVTPTTPPTCLSGTGRWAPPAGSACPAPEPRATGQLRAGDQFGMAGTSPSIRTRRTWCPVTPTAPRRVCPGPEAGHHPPGQRVQHRSPGQRRSGAPAISSAWPVRLLRFGRVEPGAR